MYVYEQGSLELDVRITCIVQKETILVDSYFSTLEHEWNSLVLIIFYSLNE